MGVPRSSLLLEGQGGGLPSAGARTQNSSAPRRPGARTLSTPRIVLRTAQCWELGQEKGPRGHSGQPTGWRVVMDMGGLQPHATWLWDRDLTTEL